MKTAKSRGSKSLSQLTIALLSMSLGCVLTSGCPAAGGSSASGGGGVALEGEPVGASATGVTCPAAPTTTSVTASGANVLPLQVGGNTYCGFNMPCTSVKVCQPGSTTNCNTINNILVDTGSFGLRIFSTAFTAPLSTSLLTPLTDGSSHPLAECAEFGSANMWGSVVAADVYLNTEAVISSMPMQLVNAAYLTIPSRSACASSVATGPSANSDSPFNGILGVGLQPYDDYGAYYYCVGSTCHSYSATTSQEVANPVAELATDNNGVIIDMQAVGGDQAAGATGVLILGIGTESNNAATGATMYQANSSGYFSTTFAGVDLTESFIDSGSNLYYFPGSQLAECSSGTICLEQTQCFDAAMTASGGSPTLDLTIRILGESDISGSTTASDAIAADGGALGMNDTFDWGLPFFFGRKVFVGISGKTSALGTGPYWAF